MSDKGINIATTVLIPYGRIADMMVCAIEGGSNYWCRGIYLLADLHGLESPWYSDPKLYEEGGFKLQVVEDEPSSEDSDGKFIIGMEEIQRGLQIMADKHKRHFTELLEEQDDADTADTFLQCAVFGELVYG